MALKAMAPVRSRPHGPEPETILNTGDAVSELTIKHPRHLLNG
jgi:hypothetical protein